jgi:hypothetical protein
MYVSVGPALASVGEPLSLTYQPPAGPLRWKLGWTLPADYLIAFGAAVVLIDSAVVQISARGVDFLSLIRQDGGCPLFVHCRAGIVADVRPLVDISHENSIADCWVRTGLVGRGRTRLPLTTFG